MYLLLFIVLFILVLKSFILNKEDKYGVKVMFFVMSLMLIFRYGQGTDYFSYIWMYNYIAIETSESLLQIFSRSDPGFNFIIYVFSLTSLSGEYFIMFIGIITTILLYRFFFVNNSANYLSLFVFYSGYYLIYQFSGIRQGLSMAIFLGILLPNLFSKNYIKYCIGVLFCASIHLSAISLLILPFIINLKINKKYLFLILSVCVCLLFLNIDVMYFLSKFLYLDRLDTYAQEEVSNNGVFAKALRIILLTPVFLIPNYVYSQEQKLAVVKNIMICSFCIYVALSSSELVASRLSAYFRVTEVLFIILLLRIKVPSLLKKSLVLFYLSIYFVMYFHNISGFIEQGSYKKVNVLTYPYIHIFEDPTIIDKYRKNIDYNLLEMSI